jgi:hypothetical protein
MTLSRPLLIVILAFSISIYGMSNFAYAQLSDEELAMFQKLGCNPDTQVIVNNECVEAKNTQSKLNPNLDLAVSGKLFAQGNTITITGKVKTIDTLLTPAVTIRVFNADNNIIAVDQFMPKSDGTFETSVLADGPLWKVKGKYKVVANYGAQKSEVFFDFSGGTGSTAPPPPPPKCRDDQILVNGVCELKEPKPVTCNPGFVLKDGKCVVKEEPTPEPEPEPEPEPTPICGEGTVLKDGKCVVAAQPKPKPTGGCLIATAAYGTELAPQVQFLREIRDNTVLSTSSGSSFMTAFNDVYYSFSPTIADWQRENPVFKESVRLFITPMMTSLSIMTLADPGSEAEVLGFGISVIMLNIGMYIAAPTIVGYKVHKRLKSRK